MELTAVNRINEGEYVSKCFPQRMGNILPIGYGGCTTAIAVRSAYQTVDAGFHLYSVLGSFHGPAKVDRNLKCRVTKTRQTRTFASRRVVAYQTQDDGSDRTCAEMFMDFHVAESGLYEYSTPPSPEYRSGPLDPLKTATGADVVRKLVEDKHVHKKVAGFHVKSFTMTEALWDIRLCLGGVAGQNAWGLARNLVTTQDHLPIYEKSTGEWFRAREQLDTEAEHMSALSWHLDGGLSFLPLFHDHKTLLDAGPASTLDFALRILRPEVKANSWIFREKRTIAAHGARTYSESRVWNEAGDAVAVMTQTCICRPLDKSRSGKTKL